jgi:4-hydroxybenzoate polyprenyltransferase
MIRCLQWCAERNLFVAAAGFALTVSTFAWLDAPVDWRLAGLIAGGSFLVYHLDRSLPFSPEDGAMRPGCPLPMLISATCAYGVLAWVFMAPALRIELACLAGFTGAYLIPCLPGRRRLKDVPFVKAFYLALIWSLATLSFPAAGLGRGTDPAALYLLGYRFLFLLPNTMLFDWPDRNGDRAGGIVTLATVLDERQLRTLAAILAAAAVSGSVLGPFGFGLPLFMLAENVATVLVMLSLRHPLTDDMFYYRVILDGLAAWPILPAGVVLIIRP